MSRWGGAGALLLLLLAACGPSPREPRAVRPESDACPECRMTVIPEGHAAEAVTEDRVWVFDDPMCLAFYVQDHPERFRDARFFVQDVETKEWIEWKDAVFVRSDAVASPMNYGVHALGTDDRARAFAALHADSQAVSDSSIEALATALKGRRWVP